MNSQRERRIASLIEVAQGAKDGDEEKVMLRQRKATPKGGERRFHHPAAVLGLRDVELARK